MLKRNKIIIAGTIAVSVVASVIQLTISLSGAGNIFPSPYKPMPESMISNFEYGSSVFNIPLERREDGTVRPLYPDTSEKQTYFMTIANLSRYSEISKDWSSLGLCRNEYDREELVPGEDLNPAIVRIGSSEPTIIQFCTMSSEQGRQFYYVKIRDLSFDIAPEGANYDGNIQGLNFTLGTRTIDIPAFSFLGSGGEFVNATFVTARFNVEVSATPEAKEGVHNFAVEFTEMPDKKSGEGRHSRAMAVYVKVTR